MTFLNDSVWNDAKQVAKQNGMRDNWVEIVDYYYTMLGCHILVFAIISEQRYRILRVTDQEQVLLLDRENEVVIRAYDEVLESRKQFFFNKDALTETEVTLPSNCSIDGTDKVKIYI